jgi:hypothetical protein
MSVNGIEHKLPEQYLSHRNGFMDALRRLAAGDEPVGKAGRLQALLDKWDSIMNDPNIPDSVKEDFVLRFNAKMNQIEETDNIYGPSSGEGFDDILKAIEEGDMEALNEVLMDSEDMDELFYAFTEAYNDAKQYSGLQEPTPAKILGGLFLSNDWEGVERYRIEHKDDDKDDGKDKA